MPLAENGIRPRIAIVAIFTISAKNDTKFEVKILLEGITDKIQLFFANCATGEFKKMFVTNEGGKKRVASFQKKYEED